VVGWTGTDPADSAGVMNVNEVAETTVGAAVVRPIVTDIPAANPRPGHRTDPGGQRASKGGSIRTREAPWALWHGMSRVACHGCGSNAPRRRPCHDANSSVATACVPQRSRRHRPAALGDEAHTSPGHVRARAPRASSSQAQSAQRPPRCRFGQHHPGPRASLAAELGLIGLAGGAAIAAVRGRALTRREHLRRGQAAGPLESREAVAAQHPRLALVCPEPRSRQRRIPETRHPSSLVPNRRSWFPRGRPR
jgi:hypothetical protein